MAVSAISGYGQIQNIYAYQNTHFNQVQNVPVTPVQKTRKASGISGDEDQLHLAATYQSAKEQTAKAESAAVAKQTEKLKNSLDAGQELKYEISNPYEASRRLLDGMLVTGMSIDVMA